MWDDELREGKTKKRKQTHEQEKVIAGMKNSRKAKCFNPHGVIWLKFPVPPYSPSVNHD